MSLLRDIQNSAVDANEPIASLLRKCKILAVRLGNSNLKNWVENELNGYQPAQNIPEYRVYTVGCKGYFAGAFGRAMKNGDIPKSVVPEEIREQLFTAYLAQPVSSIESLIKESGGGTVQEPWPSDVTAILGQQMYQGMNCLQAWKVIPVNGLVGTLDIIRNKVLNFALEIEAENPSAGDAPINSNPIPEEKVSQIFNTYISGHVQNVSTGGKNITQNAKIKSNPELFEKLIDALVTANADSEVTDNLTETVEEMRSTAGTKEFMNHYHNFMSILADNMQVYGPIVAPFLPALASILP